jgi:hypothetical protein
MKLIGLASRLTPSVLACSLALVAFSPGSRGLAQNSSGHLVADIPFEFQSGSEMMPAGRYDIQQLSDHVLIVSQPNQHRSQFLIVIRAETLRPPARGKLIFHRYGSRYFLYQVWSPNLSTGFELTKSHAEKEALRAENNPAPSTTELALNEGAQR